ncbi:hypothetical protein V6N12_070359 [Hibiscus sabdariffa]|uniref:DUF4283 domain-containing protein n=1 Tax=Hibiscus sabdariffa TaxID=183260 RepID=A0ABR2FGQ3_9ROSI
MVLSKTYISLTTIQRGRIEGILSHSLDSKPVMKPGGQSSLEMEGKWMGSSSNASWGEVPQLHYQSKKNDRQNHAKKFETSDEARRAIELGNGRKMDGFIIKCFLGRSYSTLLPVKGIRTDKQDMVKPKVGNDLSKVTDGRSYKEALLSYEAKIPVKSTDRTEISTDFVKGDEAGHRKPDFEPYHFSVPKKELEWLDRCIIGQVKWMYDADFVQQALCSKGFIVKVCTWSGFYSIIQFDEEEQIQIFWDLQESMLRNWFVDLHTLEHFTSNYKLKVWIILENDGIFKAIGNKWGRVLKIDEDTTLKNRFNNARILITVKQRTNVPQTINLFINGTQYCIKVSIADYEDERVWINADVPEFSIDGKTSEERDKDNIYRFKDLDTCHNLAEMDEDVEKTGEANHYFGSEYEDPIGSTCVELPSNHYTVEGLTDVPIVCASELTKSSYGSSHLLGPLLDTETRLYLVKTKYAKHQISLTPFSFRYRLDKIQRWAGIGNSTNLKKRGKQKSKEYNPDPSEEIPKIVSKHADPNDFDGQKANDKAEDSEVSANKVEAEITLKMAKDLGVQFADSDQSVLKQLEILETGAT